MRASNKKIVICGGVRTPFGHFSKSLAHIRPEDLMALVIQALVKRAGLNAQRIDGVIVGWVAQDGHAPNLARVAAQKAGGLRETATALTVQANCLSGLEAICTAARHILTNDGELYVAGGTESMSGIPFSIFGSRADKALRTLDTVKAHWSELLNDPDVAVRDTIEDGLVDPIKRLTMAATAEVCAQLFDIPREEQDRYAHESFKRCQEGEEAGFYRTHVVPVTAKGQTILESDEYVQLRKGLISKPDMFGKAPRLFDSEAFSIKDFYGRYSGFIDGKSCGEDTEGTVTLFNSCARSDGAAAVLVATEEVAKDLGLEILGEIKSWSVLGHDAAYMGISPLFATEKALKSAGVEFSDLDEIELHEAFAATCLSIFKLGLEKFGQDWRTPWEDRRLNRFGGSIPLGHPVGATGARIILNLLYSMKQNPDSRYGLATACSGGGLGGAMVLERAA